MPQDDSSFCGEILFLGRRKNVLFVNLEKMETESKDADRGVRVPVGVWLLSFRKADRARQKCVGCVHYPGTS